MNSLKIKKNRKDEALYRSIILPQLIIYTGEKGKRNVWYKR